MNHSNRVDYFLKNKIQLVNVNIQKCCYVQKGKIMPAKMDFESLQISSAWRHRVPRRIITTTIKTATINAGMATDQTRSLALAFSFFLSLLIAAVSFFTGPFNCRAILL